MIERLLSVLSDGLAASPQVAIPVAFAWGLVSIVLSPCHLSSVPLVVGYVNRGEVPTVKRAFTLSLVFASGVVVSIAAIGAITAAMGRLVGDLGHLGTYFLVATLAFFGLVLLDLIPLPQWASPLAGGSRGPVGAVSLGLAFGIGLGPCTFAFAAPVMFIVFAQAATNIVLAVLILASFTLGHCSVIVGAGTAGPRLGRLISWGDHTRGLQVLRRACGGLLVVAAVYTA
ncbi:MAG: cytochrome c biogenesis CcdA family protein, partial [Thermoleophilia bacterium]